MLITVHIFVIFSTYLDLSSERKKYIDEYITDANTRFNVILFVLTLDAQIFYLGGEITCLYLVAAKND